MRLTGLALCCMFGCHSLASPEILEAYRSPLSGIQCGALADVPGTVCWDGKDYLVTRLAEGHGWQRGVRLEIVSTTGLAGQVLAIAWVVEPMQNVVRIHIVHQRKDLPLVGAKAKIIGRDGRARLEHLYGKIRSVGGDQLELDLGEADGVSKGMIYEVRKEDDPDRAIGSARIIQTRGQSSTASLETTAEQIKPGDELVYLREGAALDRLAGHVLVHDFTPSDEHDEAQISTSTRVPQELFTRLKQLSAGLFDAGQFKRARGPAKSLVVDPFQEGSEALVDDVIISGETVPCGDQLCSNVKVRRGSESPSLPSDQIGLLLGYLAIATEDWQLASHYLRRVDLASAAGVRGTSSVSASVLIDLARAEQRSGQRARAQQWARKGVEVALKRGEFAPVRAGLLMLGDMASSDSETRVLTGYVGESKKLARSHPELRHLSSTLDYQLSLSRGERPSAEELEQSAKLAQGDGDDQSAEVLYRLSSEVASGRGDAGAAIELAQLAWRQSARLGLCVATPQSAIRMAQLRQSLGEPADTGSRLRMPATCSGSERREPGYLALANQNALLSGRHAERIEELRRDSEAMRRAGQKLQAGIYDYFRGKLQLSLGDKTSKATLERALKDFRKLQAHDFLVRTLVALAQHHLRTTELRAARDLLDHANALARQAGDSRGRLDALLTQVLLDLQEGHLKGANENLDRVRELLEGTENLEKRGEYELLRGIASQPQGMAGARIHYQRARDSFDRKNDPGRWALAVRQLALTYIEEDPRRAHRELSAAKDSFRQVSDTPNILRTTVYLLWVEDLIQARSGGARESVGRQGALKQLQDIIKKAKAQKLDRLRADAHTISGCLNWLMSAHAEAERQFIQATGLYKLLGIHDSKWCIKNEAASMPASQW